MEINMKNGTYTYNGKLHNFNFCIDLGIANKVKFVNSVVSLVVDKNHYNSVIRDLIFDFYIVDIMTDIDTAEFKDSPTFLNDVEDFLLSTNIAEIVKANVFPTLFDELNTAVDKSIQYLTGIHPSPLSDAIASFLSALEKKINEVDLDSMMDMAHKFAGMTGELTPESIMNAYMNSDIHKKNMVELEDAKKQKAEFTGDMDNAIKAVNKKSKK